MSRDGFIGLTQAEADRRLAEFGPNALPRAAGRGLAGILLDTLREPMFLLLIGAAGLYLVLGDLGEGLFLMAGAVATIGLVVLQEARSERALSALRDLSQPYARVVRDGVEARLAARDLVPGDIILIGEGERLPADGVLVGGDVLSVDESALTGESAPVSKRPLIDGEAIDADVQPGAEAGPYLFSGALVVRGQAVAQVERTGARTALGRIGVSLAAIVHQPTPLQKTAGRLVTLLGALAIAFCAVVAVAYGLLRGDWIGGVLAGVTVAIALIPEEFPMVLAVFLALGAGRLARRKVLVRRSAVIEALGGASFLCVDKTGTLTENRMRVARVWTPGEDWAVSADTPPPDSSRHCLRVAGLACAVRPVDPMDKAVRALLDGPEPETPEGPERTWPLRPERMAMVQAWRQPEDQWRIAAKGAPEAIFRLCRLTEAEIGGLVPVVERFARQGLRVLAVASCMTAGPLSDFPEDMRFTFEGLIGFLDPVREDVPAALKEAQAAGISVVMITGDHPATALAVAEAAGLDASGGVLIGPEIAALDDAALAARLRHTRLFARITPDQKLRIVQALKAAGQVVAMTGDGVNDAPALSRADIGVAMGITGTDVAKEASDMVLLDDNFTSIVGAVREGRHIFDNIRKFIKYAMAANSGEVWTILLAPLVGMQIPLLPIHILWVNLVTDGLPGLALSAEPAEKNIMHRPPRAPNESIFADGLGWHILWVGLVMGAATLFTQAAFIDHEKGHWQTMVFTVLCLSQMGHVLAVRSDRESFFKQGFRSNPQLTGAVLLTFVLQMGTIYIPVVNESVFRTQPLTFSELVIALAISTVVFWGVELEKLIKRSRDARAI